MAHVLDRLVRHAEWQQTEQPPALELQHVTAGYDGPPVLRDLSLQVPSGTLFAVLGPNGSGKSTLFKLISGVMRAQKGSVRVQGQLLAVARRSGAIAYVPQEEAIDWSFPISVREVVFGGRHAIMRRDGIVRFAPYRFARSAHQHAVDSALEAVEMLDMQHARIGALSGGQKKRVFLARALAQEAAVILLDEPFAGVDYRTQERITSVLERERRRGKTVVVVTHDLHGFARQADRVLLLARGGRAHGGAPDDVLRHDVLSEVYEGLVTA